MAAVKHEFYESLKVGVDGENVLDAYFESQYIITEASMVFQKLGVDRFFREREPISGVYPQQPVFSVEYKTEHKEENTGKVFVEIISDDEKQTDGWAIKSIAQVLVVYLPHRNLALWGNMFDIKFLLYKWIGKYTVKPSQNKDKADNQIYKSWGICVDYEDFASVMKETITNVL